MSEIGTLEDFKIADVLKLLASGRKTGVLKVTSGEQEAEVWFTKGTIVSAGAGRFRGDAAVLDLFGWKEGQLSFLPEEHTPTATITRDVESLIEEGVRVGGSFHRIKTQIPSERVVFRMAEPPAGARLSVGRDEWRVLRSLDGQRDVRAVIEASGVAREEVHRILTELAEAGFLERIQFQKVLRAESQSRLAKDAAVLDSRLEEEWMKLARFAQGVHRIEVRSLAGRRLALAVTYKTDLFRNLHLSRVALAELGIHDGEEVFVRPKQ